MKNLKLRHLLIWGTVAGVTIGIPLYLGRWTDALVAIIFGAIWALAASTVHHLRDLELEEAEIATAEQARADRLAGDYVVPPPPAIRMDAYNDDSDLDDDTGEFDTEPHGDAEPTEQPAQPRIWRRVLLAAAGAAGAAWRHLAPSLTVLRLALVDEQEPGRHRAPDEPDREPDKPYRRRHGAPDPDETAELVPVAAIEPPPPMRAIEGPREVAADDLPLSKQRDDWRWDTVEFQKAAISFFAEEAANVRA